MLSINKIILDHEAWVKLKIFQATMLLDPNSTRWLHIRSNLEAKYKFTIDLDTFAEILGAGICVLPSRSALWSKKSSVVELFVRYNFEHGQDSAVREMLLLGLTERNRVEFYPSLTRLYINHRFASFIPPNLLGIIKIKINNSDIKESEIEKLINNWDHISKNINQQKLSYDSYHSFLETLL